jgi:broad specificity phosphatase PhoE
MTTFYLVRHGEKENVASDPPLTSAGIKQAELTAEHLKGISFKRIISSPKRRTTQTAEIIAKEHYQIIVTDGRLTERLEWEDGESLDDFMSEWDKTDIDRKYLPKKGLSSSANGKRIRQALDKLYDKQDGENILVVTHGGTIGDLLRNLFTEKAIEHKQDPLSGARYIEILECAVTIVQKENKKFKLLKLADTSHLQQ